MRALIVLLALGLLAGVAAPGSAATPDKPDARMLLDLDLLREIDPRAQPAPPVVHNMRLLEFLRRLQSPAAATPSPGAAPSPKGAC
jgi:hypothetical protein